MKRRSGGENRFPRTARVLRAVDFRRALRTGRRVSSGPFTIHIGRAEQAGVRLGLIVGRRTGAAVVRNRIKRLLREDFRRNRSTLPPGTDLVVVVTRALGFVAGAALRRAVAEAFRAATAARPAGGRRRGTRASPPR